MMDSSAVVPGLDGNVLAFRVYIIMRMNQILNDDRNKVRRPGIDEF